MYSYSTGKLAFVALGALLLGGCTGDLPADDMLKNTVISAEETEKNYTMDAKWWQLYRQEALNKTVDLALERNIDLAKAGITLTKALYQAHIIEADLFPTFSADGSAQSRRDISKHASSTRSFEGSVGVSYEFDLWRRVATSASAKEWEAKATERDLEATRLSLINSVIDAWFDIKYLREALELAEATEKRYRKLHTITEAKYELGQVASVEPMQTYQSLLSARNTVLSMQNQLTVALETMRNLLNLAPDENFPENTIQLTDIVPIEPDLDVPLRTLSARPDVAAAADRLNSMFYELKTTQRSWFPQITLGGTLGVSSNKTSTFFDVPFLSGVARISFPFLDWQNLRWETKSAEADFENAKLTFTSAVTTAVNEISSAYAQYTATKKNLHNTKLKLETERKIAAYYEARYQEGSAELKDVVAALNTVASSESDVLNEHYQMLSWENKIYRAMGGRFTTK